jgi:hypothetical protein
VIPWATDQGQCAIMAAMRAVSAKRRPKSRQAMVEIDVQALEQDRFQVHVTADGSRHTYQVSVPAALAERLGAEPAEVARATLAFLLDARRRSLTVDRLPVELPRLNVRSGDEAESARRGRPAAGNLAAGHRLRTMPVLRFESAKKG